MKSFVFILSTYLEPSSGIFQVMDNGLATNRRTQTASLFQRSAEQLRRQADLRQLLCRSQQPIRQFMQACL